MAWFPQEAERFVGRTPALIATSRALAPDSGHTGVLFVGMAGAGKSSCALEAAYQHRDQFGAFAWWKAPTSPTDLPHTSMNAKTMAQYRPQLEKFYYDPAKYKTYLERLGITYPTVKP